MNILFKTLATVLVAAALSALYLGWQKTGSLAFDFSAGAALWFVAAGLAGLFTGLIKTGGQATASKTTPSRPAKAAGTGRLQGEVKWFNGAKGFGFISCDDGTELFVHFRSVRKDSPRLAPGKRVEYAVVEGKKGPEADDVTVI